MSTNDYKYSLLDDDELEEADAVVEKEEGEKEGEKEAAAEIEEVAV